MTPFLIRHHKQLVDEGKKTSIVIVRVVRAVLTSVHTDTAQGAADEQTGAVLLQVSCGRMDVCAILGGGGETSLWNQRLGPHLTPGQKHGRLALAPFRLNTNT